MKNLGLTKSQEEFLENNLHPIFCYTKRNYIPSTWTYNPATGLVDVEGNFVARRGIKSFMGVKFGKVSGDFICKGTKLTSLEGAPQVVGRSFLCRDSKLTSLVGAPQVVGDSFICYGNQLTSLEGAPQVVRNSFCCHNNQLTRLAGAPQKVGGRFDCRGNKLTSLEGAPQVVGENFDCSNNILTSLKGAPQKVRYNFDCSNNNLTSLKGAPQKVGSEFICRNNKLTSLKGAPKEVRSFDCRGNNLTSLKGAPQNPYLYDFWCDAFRSYKWKKGWNLESWLNAVRRGGLKTKKLLVTLLPADTLNKEIAKNPARMIMSLKEVWNDENFKETRSKLVLPKGYELEADLVGDLYGAGF